MELSVTVRVDTIEVSKDVTGGYHQGSLVGYPLWNILFDMIMNPPYEDGSAQERMPMTGCYWLRQTQDRKAGAPE